MEFYRELVQTTIIVILSADYLRRRNRKKK
jgi:hypothetical protein